MRPGRCLLRLQSSSSARHLAFLSRRQNASFLRYNHSASSASAGKPYYITTPIFYPNAVPHVGHLYSLVAGDIFARYQRLVSGSLATDYSSNVHYLAGTDEHGLKIQKAAQAKDMDPQEFCDTLSRRFRTLGERAQVSNTIFMRTTDPAHHHAVETVWKTLEEKNYIYKSSYSGYYSITDECFYPPSQVTTDSTTGQTVSKETGSVVEWQEEENWMFKLSSFQDFLLDNYTLDGPDFLQDGKTRIHPPHEHDRILSILREAPLEDLSISRPRSRLTWGIPVPGDLSQTVYVWFDALLVYLSGIGFPFPSQPSALQTSARPYWPWPPNLQIIGKDILRFHALYLPAILHALDLPTQRTILSHSHWTVSQKKMSKSLGNVADPFAAMNKYGVDMVRYYLGRVGGRWRDDVDWSDEQLQKHSRELVSLLGNYFLRIGSKAIAGSIEESHSFPDSLSGLQAEYPSSPHNELLKSIEELPSKYRESMDNLEIADALAHVIDLLRLGNKILSTTEPWLPDTAPSEVYFAHTSAVEALRVAAVCLTPFIPGASATLLDGILQNIDFASIGQRMLGRTDVPKQELDDGRERTWQSVLAPLEERPAMIVRQPVPLFKLATRPTFSQ